MEHEKKFNSRIIFINYIYGKFNDIELPINETIELYKSEEQIELDVILLDKLIKKYNHEEINNIRIKYQRHSDTSIDDVTKSLINSAINELLIEKEYKIVLSVYLSIAYVFNCNKKFINGLLNSVVKSR